MKMPLQLISPKIELKFLLIAKGGRFECYTVIENKAEYRKVNPYGVEAMVVRSVAPASVNISPISIEELFVFMVKGAR